MTDPNIVLYTGQSPNGIKVVSTLEELGLPYTLHKVEVSHNTQKEPWFLEVNPNGRIPAMTDTFTDGETIRVFESGAIQTYLVERYDPMHRISFPKASREWHEMNCWLFFLNANIGPMQGQATHFRLYAPDTLEYPILRYLNECKRLYTILDKHLSTCPSGFLVGDKCTIADLAHYGWVSCTEWSGFTLDKFPSVKKWKEMMSERPAIVKARGTPDLWTFESMATSQEVTEAFSKVGRDWFRRQVAEDFERFS